MASSRDAPFSGTTITYQAAPGEANVVTVNCGNVAAGPDFIPTLDDHVDITAREPCEYDTALGARCPMLRRSRRFKVRDGDAGQGRRQGEEPGRAAAALSGAQRVRPLRAPHAVMRTTSASVTHRE
jgi:hypothetical protein